METIPENEIQTTTPPAERLAYSVQEAADMLGIQLFHHVSADPAAEVKNVPGAARKLLVPRTELLQLLQTDLR